MIDVLRRVRWINVGGLLAVLCGCVALAAALTADPPSRRGAEENRPIGRPVATAPVGASTGASTGAAPGGRNADRTGALARRRRARAARRRARRTRRVERVVTTPPPPHAHFTPRPQRPRPGVADLAP